jgi:hypothetical protein
MYYAYMDVYQNNKIYRDLLLVDEMEVSPR